MSILANPPSPCPRVQPGRPWIAIVLLLPVLLATPATAAPITYAFRGTIHHADVDSGVQAGDPFSGTVTFDPAGPVDRSVYKNAYPTSEYHATSLDYGRATPGGPSQGAGMSLAVAGRPVFSFDQGLSVGVHSYWADYHGTVSSSTSVSILPDSHPGEGIKVGPALTLVNSSFIPESAAEWTAANLDLADFSAGYLDVHDRILMPEPFDAVSDRSPRNGRGFAGSLESFEIVPTPEPSTFALLGLGVAGWVIRRRRRANGPVPPERLEDVA